MRGHGGQTVRKERDTGVLARCAAELTLEGVTLSAFGPRRWTGLGLASSAAHGQEACSHVCGRVGRGTFGQRVAVGVRQTWITLSAVKPWVERWH